LSGRETLTSMDQTLGELRREAEALDAQFQQASVRLSELRQKELVLFAQLARVRMQELERGELLQALDDTDRQVTELLAARKRAQETLSAEIATAEKGLEAYERERAAQQSAIDAAAQALDAAEADAQQMLAEDEAYQAAL